MKNTLLVAGVVGLVVGYGSTFTLFIHSWTALLAWACIAVVLGAFTTTTDKEAIVGGALYGFLLCMAFLIGGFQGSSDKLPLFIALSGVLSMIGVVGGALASWVGLHAARALRR